MKGLLSPRKRLFWILLCCLFWEIAFYILTGWPAWTAFVCGFPFYAGVIAFDIFVTELDRQMGRLW